MYRLVDVEAEWGRATTGEETNELFNCVEIPGETGTNASTQVQALEAMRNGTAVAIVTFMMMAFYN